VAGETESSVGKRLREALRLIRDGALTTGDDFQRHVEGAHRALVGATQEMADVALTIATNRINLNDETVYRSETPDSNLAFDLFKQGLRKVTFRLGIAAAEVSAFMRALAECRDATVTDVDFISTLWQEELEHIRYVAIDSFTEKLFMSEEAFTRRFRAAIDDQAPDLATIDEEDAGDRKRRQYAVLDDFNAVEVADAAGAENSRELARMAAPFALRLRESLGVPALDHLVRLHACVLVKDPQPLSDVQLGEITTRLLEGYLEEKAWEGFAAAARSLWRLLESRNGFRPAVTTRLEGLRAAVAGGPVMVLCATHQVGAPKQFSRWARWFFTDCAILQAPEILAAINQSETAEATEFLKDLLHRQGTASLEPWAARLRDPNPGVVLEVLEVILQSPLGGQARPLLIECLRNADAAVRTRAVAGLARDYDLKVREVLLPFLKDEAAEVRKEVLLRFVKAGDKSVAPYLASCIRGGPFGGHDEDEQRMFFEGLARLGGMRFLDVFKERLRLEGDGNPFSRFLRRGAVALADDSVRRGAVAGLALMGTPEAKALLQEVRDRAENTLASHCEVVVRMASRDGFQQSAQDAALERSAPLEDLASARSVLGERLIFEPADVLVPPPHRPRPTGAVEVDDVAPVAAPASPVAAYVPDPTVPLAERPLLGVGERFEGADVRELVATPAFSEGKRFRMTSPRAILVAVEVAEAPRPSPAVAAPVRAPVGPVIERSTPVSGLDLAGLPRRGDGPEGSPPRESMRSLTPAAGIPTVRLPPERPAEGAPRVWTPATGIPTVRLPADRPVASREAAQERSLTPATGTPTVAAPADRPPPRSAPADVDRPHVEHTHERTVIRPLASRPEPGRPEPGRPEPGRPEPGRPDPARPSPPVHPGAATPLSPPRNLEALLKGYLNSAPPAAAPPEPDLEESPRIDSGFRTPPPGRDAMHPAPPVAHPAPPVAHPAPPVAHPAPPVAHPAPPVAHPAPPVAHPAPPVAHPAPNDAPAPPETPPEPRKKGLDALLKGFLDLDLGD